MIVKKLLSFMVLVGFAGLMVGDVVAAPKIMGVSTEQNAKTGAIKIKVKLSGAAKDLAAYEIVFNAKDIDRKDEMPIQCVVKEGEDVVAGSTRTRTFIWDVEEEFGRICVDVKVALKVDLVESIGGVQLWEGGPFWAECNVGATKSEETGYFFWWGDTVGYKRNSEGPGWVSAKDGSVLNEDENTYYLRFDESRCLTYKKDASALRSSGYLDVKGNLALAHDAARVHLGAPWRMPTKDEFMEMSRNCNRVSTIQNGTSGTLVMGRDEYSSRKIFLPEDFPENYGISDRRKVSWACGGTWWTSTPASAGFAWTIGGYGSAFPQEQVEDFWMGHPVRPVYGCDERKIQSTFTKKFTIKKAKQTKNKSGQLRKMGTVPSSRD